jgi:hypothetical protein
MTSFIKLAQELRIQNEESYLERHIKTGDWWESWTTCWSFFYLLNCRNWQISRLLLKDTKVIWSPRKMSVVSIVSLVYRNVVSSICSSIYKGWLRAPQVPGHWKLMNDMELWFREESPHLHLFF